MIDRPLKQVESLRRVHSDKPRLPELAIALLFAVLAIASSARAQLPAARLNAIFPPGGKTGTSVDVTVSGVDLDGASEIRFSQPGITSKSSDESDNTTDRKFTVTIAPEVAPGNYEARVVGRFGITNPRTFAIGDLKELDAPAKDPSTTPQPLFIDAVANGRCPANLPNLYTLELKQAEHVLIECAAKEIDSKLLPVMVLGSPDGRELAESRHGGLIDFTVPIDGTYTLQIHDLLYRGGPEYFYRLSVHTGPYLDAIFPPAGMPGSRGKYTLYGRNLPGAKPTNLRGFDGKPLQQLDVEIELPSDPIAPAKSDTASLLGALGAGIDAISYRLRSDKGVSNPVLIGFARAPMVMETPAADQPGKGQKVTPPCEIAGRFYPHGDHDVYTFDAAKGDVFWFEIFSERLGLPTSPELLIQKVGKSNKGEEQVSDVQDVGGPDMQPMQGKRGGGSSAAFTGQSRDIEYRFESKEPGTYRVTVRDLFGGSTDNAALVYRMSIHKESPDFRLLATTAPIPDPKGGNNNAASLEPGVLAPFLRKGGAVPIRVNIFRKDGFDAEVHIEAEGLPSAVHCSPAVIAPEESYTTLLLTADENAQTWVGAVRIVGKAKVGDEEKVREARVGAVVWPTIQVNNNTEKGIARLSCDMSLAVSADELEPISIKAEGSVFEVKAGGKLHIPVKIKHRTELNQPLKLQVAGLPGKNNAKIEMTIAATADSGGFDLDLNQTKLAPGTYTFYLQALVQVKYERKGAPDKTAKPDGGKKKNDAKDTQATFYSQPITLKVLAK